MDSRLPITLGGGILTYIPPELVAKNLHDVSRDDRVYLARTRLRAVCVHYRDAAVPRFSCLHVPHFITSWIQVVLPRGFARRGTPGARWRRPYLGRYATDRYAFPAAGHVVRLAAHSAASKAASWDAYAATLPRGARARHAERAARLPKHATCSCEPVSRLLANEQDMADVYAAFAHVAREEPVFPPAGFA